MKSNYLRFVSQKAKLVLLLNLLLVFTFASLYYIQDYIISYYPHFSEKYLLEYKNNNHNNDNNKHKFTLKPFLYYIWFSLITQSNNSQTIFLRSLIYFQGLGNIQDGILQGYQHYHSQATVSVVCLVITSLLCKYCHNISTLLWLSIVITGIRTSLLHLLKPKLKTPNNE